MRLLLNGGGSGIQITDSINKLNEIIDHSKPLLYIPLAIDLEIRSYDECYEWITNEFSNVDILKIDMVKTIEELYCKNLDDYCAIFIGGGNTYKLLKELKDSNCFDKIKNYILNDGIVFGASAGAVIFGYDINSIESMDLNNVCLTDTKGFDCLSGVSIFPHYTNIKSKLSEQQNIERHNKFTEAIKDFSLKTGPIMAYPEEDTIYINGNEIEVIGTKKLYYVENGNMVICEPTSNFSMDCLKKF